MRKHVGPAWAPEPLLKGGYILAGKLRCKQIPWAGCEWVVGATEKHAQWSGDYEGGQVLVRSEMGAIEKITLEQRQERGMGVRYDDIQEGALRQWEEKVQRYKMRL